jgi:myb proto-oncogene protein
MTQSIAIEFWLLFMSCRLRINISNIQIIINISLFHMQLKQNYRVNPTDLRRASIQMRGDKRSLSKMDNLESTKRLLTHEPHSLESLRKKGRYDIGYRKMASQEAARAAAVAIAEAEAAAAAAESAAKEAEDAEAEAEAAMIVMELAALAAQESRKGGNSVVCSRDHINV